MQTLEGLMRHFFRVYSRRNRAYLESRHDRIDLLNLGVGDLQDAVRKVSNNQELIGKGLARVVSRIFCVAEGFEGSSHRGLPLIEKIVAKYPMGACTYCEHDPCECPEIRPESNLRENRGDASTLTLGAWARALNTTYGERNRKKGIDDIVSRLFKEVCELYSLNRLIEIEEMTLDKIEEEFALELADALAWTVAIANYFDIDLEAMVIERYSKGCGVCKNNPCNCSRFDVHQVVWKSLAQAIKTP